MIPTVSHHLQAVTVTLGAGKRHEGEMGWAQGLGGVNGRTSGYGYPTCGMAGAKGELYPGEILG